MFSVGVPSDPVPPTVHACGVGLIWASSPCVSVRHVRSGRADGQGMHTVRVVIGRSGHSKSAVERLKGSSPFSGTELELFENLFLHRQSSWPSRKPFGS